jgi:6-pyruvoyl-tetrahydropterin synthase
LSRWVLHAHAAFEGRHALTSYLGKSEPSHSHRWEVAIRVGTDSLNDEGYTIDFDAVHRTLREAVTPLDGSDLNLHPEIGSPTPTAERVAVVVAGWLQDPLAKLGGTLLSISVWEGPENRVDLNLDER